MGGGTASLRWLAVMSGVAPLADPAFAGAWTQKVGEQQWIATLSHATGEFGDAWRADDHGEFGLGDGWGINFKAEGELRTADTFDDRTGFRVGMQKSFALGDRAAFSVMGSWLGGEALDGPECASNGYEARTALGTSYAVAGREGFVNIEAAWRARGEECERGLVEVAAGLEVAPRWSMLVKAWHEEGDGALSTKAEASLIHDFGPIAVGVGWREEISGEFEEKGWIATARTRF
jgi:hypothetical protein